MLIVTSACHGVEGHCGSGVQVLRAARRRMAREGARAGRGRAVRACAQSARLFARPARDARERRPQPQLLRLRPSRCRSTRPTPSCTRCCCPQQWPPTADNQAAIGAWIEKHGVTAYQAAVTRGQYQFDDGLFFGGKAPTWSNNTLAPGAAHAGAGGAPAGLDRPAHGPGPERPRRAHLCLPRRQGRLCPRQRLVGHAGRAGDLDLRRLVDLGLPDRPDVERDLRGMPAGRVHRHRAGIRHACRCWK